jgi:hypothetical protein
LKKKIWISVLILAIVIGGLYSLVKFNPPLEIGTLASREDKKSVVVGIGNKGFLEVENLDVSINNNEKPLKLKVQESNALQGFIITDDYDNLESKKYGFKDIEDITIKVGSDSSSYLKKLNDGSATKDDEIYGISVIHNEAIFKVHIKYSYLGISFSETAFFN